MVMIVVLILLCLGMRWCRIVTALARNSPPENGSRPKVDTPYGDSKFSNRAREKTVVLLYHKPPNVITSHVSEDSRSTVYEEIQSMNGYMPRQKNDQVISPTKETTHFEKATGIRSKLHAIGRLDAETTGVLLVTNDGGLVHHVTNRKAPSHSQNVASMGPITKTYEALIMGLHDMQSLSVLWDGVDIGAKYGGMTRPVDDLQILEHPSHKSTLVSLTISEGKNRQVRRMFHALGSGVMNLKRTKIGEHLTLDAVAENGWRILTDQEVRDHLGWEIRDLDTDREKRLSNKAFPRKQTNSAKPQRAARRRQR